MTHFTDIYDLFLSEIKDPKIDKIYNQSVTNFESYLKNFLLLAIPEFDNCKKNLSDKNDDSQVFNQDLTLEEQKILVNWMIYHWFLKEVQDVRQFSLHLQSTDFKTFAEANNLKEKSAYAENLRERFTQRNVDYGLKTIPWEQWYQGNYSGS